MVHIKRIELAHFKSFGGTTRIPLLPGFTVISGPNGSGKSNILDALLFCLGLASSRGMRAERLPDLVNHQGNKDQKKNRAEVSVTFDLSELDQGDWTVTRKLKVNPGGNYTSTYYVNGESCNLNELHQRLGELRIYPEGYNVVLQGDVTRIITMNSRERREIIDELAGVAEFDRKIEQTKKTLEQVRETEERYRIIEQELVKNRDRLATDRLKAEKYQQLKLTLHQKQEQVQILGWYNLLSQQEQLQQQIQTQEQQLEDLVHQIAQSNQQIEITNQQWQDLNQTIKNLGEEEQLNLASELAQNQAKAQQLRLRQQELTQQLQQAEQLVPQRKAIIAHHQEEIDQYSREYQNLQDQTLPLLREQQEQAARELGELQQQQQAIALQSQTTIAHQTHLSQTVSNLQSQLHQQEEQTALETERQHQLEQKIQHTQQLLNQLQQQLVTKSVALDHLSSQLETTHNTLTSLNQDLTVANSELHLAQTTQDRLSQEQREKQRQLDKLETTQQVQQEAQGTYTTNFLLNANLPGVCGLVAQLGQVEPPYQLALEIAAGGRLLQIVVDDEKVAAQAIELLKQKRAGRATFLPLNKIQAPRPLDLYPLRSAPGYLDLALNLVECEPRYRQIFAYVLGNTVVFEDLATAKAYLGRYRLVTLAGELLETSGAMTGGHFNPKSSGIRFGLAPTSSSGELESLKTRLEEIEQILRVNQGHLGEYTQKIRQIQEQLNQTSQAKLKLELELKQKKQEVEEIYQQVAESTKQLSTSSQELIHKQEQLGQLRQIVADLKLSFEQAQQEFANFEGNSLSEQWRSLQALAEIKNGELQQIQEQVRTVQNQGQNLLNQIARLTEKQQEATKQIESAQEQQREIKLNQVSIASQIELITEKIKQAEGAIATLTVQLTSLRQERDQLEKSLEQQRLTRQNQLWEQEKLLTTQQQHNSQLVQLTEQITTYRQDLPDPIPELPPQHPNLETLNTEIKSVQKRLEALEPVNMLALEEYDANQQRLDELSQKLTTLQGERTELLLRIENFTTLRQTAFKEAFDAVNQDFQEIFATLSDGDGCLQLDNPDDPLQGGLNLIAHPKGKPVQRLSSMSGGEKSLTALSFIFALQRYRPSPFYAFDEVDMFLDGANVEKLSRMIKYQAQQAQFMVVSLRRPMIEASQRTIGVTQAKGGHTQVLGIKI